MSILTLGVTQRDTPGFSVIVGSSELGPEDSTSGVLLSKKFRVPFS